MDIHRGEDRGFRQSRRRGEVWPVSVFLLSIFLSLSLSLLISGFSKDWAELPASSSTWEPLIRNGIVEQRKESHSEIWTLPGESCFFSTLETNGWKVHHKTSVQSPRGLHVAVHEGETNIGLFFLSTDQTQTWEAMLPPWPKSLTLNQICRNNYCSYSKKNKSNNVEAAAESSSPHIL